MRKIKPMYVGITFAIVIAVAIIIIMLSYNQQKQDLSRTDYAIVVSVEKGLTDDADLTCFIEKSNKGEPCNLRITTMYEDGIYIEEVFFDGHTFSGKAEGKEQWGGFPYIFDKVGEGKGAKWRILVFSKKEKVTFNEAMMSTGLSSDLRTYEQMHGIFL